MTTQLQMTTEYISGAWRVTSEVISDDKDFPREIFLWTLDSKGALKEFQAIGQIDQVTRYPLYNSSRTNNFGVHLVRSSTGVQTLKSEEEVHKVRIVLRSAFQRLLDGYDKAAEPVVELYPGELDV